MEDQGRRTINHVVSRHEDVSVTKTNDATLISKSRLRRKQLQPQSAPAEITSVISGGSRNGMLHQPYEAIKEGF
jgi:hypothetical protein